MSKAGLIIALALAAVLSAVTYVILKRDAPAPTSGSLLGTLDIGRVRTVEITGVTGTRAFLTLGGPGDAYWVLEWTTAPGSTSKWPASTTRVRAALRLLGALKTSPQAGTGKVPWPATRIALSADNGQHARLSVSTSPLGGHTAVSAEGVPGIALGEESLSSVFTGDLAPWLEPAIFPIDPADASRFEVTGGTDGAGLSVARVGRNWGLVKPIAAPGDGPFIAEILKHLGSTGAQRFSDDQQAGSFTPASPRVTIEIDRRVPSGDQVRRTTVFQELLIGGPGDVGGQTVLCQARAWTVDGDTGNRTELWGPVVAVVARTALEAIQSAPAAYLSRTSTRTPSADVGGLSLSVAQKPGDLSDAHPALSLVRATEGWRNQSGPVPPDSSKIADAIVTLVTQDRAAAVSTTPPTGYTPAARAVLNDRSSAPLDDLEIGLLADASAAQQKTLGVKGASVYRVYDTPAAAALATWLADRLRN